MRPQTATELALFTVEAVGTIAYARYLHLLGRRYEPDWTWLTVLTGVILSSAPTIVLARLAPADWRRYELRALTGFLVSGGVIIPWQLWLSASRRGEERGYLWGHHDTSAPMERAVGEPASGS